MYNYNDMNDDEVTQDLCAPGMFTQIFTPYLNV